LAYNAYIINPVAGAAIQATAGPLIGNLDLTGAVDVILEGGYDAGFTSNAGYTTIIGTFTIMKGSGRVKNLAISP
jgi:hypothetical protein